MSCDHTKELERRIKELEEIVARQALSLAELDQTARRARMLLDERP